jgi:hypothetical protein
MIHVPNDTPLWEVVGSLQVAQARHVALCGPSQLAIDIAELSARIIYLDPPEHIELNYSKAYRAIDTSENPYPVVLAAQSGITINTDAVMKIQLPGIQPGTRDGIIVCPKTFKPELALPPVTWRAIVRMLRSYDRPVYLMGEPGEWMDDASFAENEILTELPLKEKLEWLAGAELIVGVPNAWLWLAAAWEKKIAFLYPDSIPKYRWFWFASDSTYGRISFVPYQLQTAVVLTGLRTMIDAL